MKVKLLDYLLCPACRAAAWNLSKGKVRRDEIITGRLVCSTCRSVYDIVEGIPIMLIPDDQHRWTLETNDYLETYTFEITPTISKLISEHSGALNLDAGCGKGANIPHFKGTVVALDVSFPFVLSLQRQYGFRDNLHYVVGDIRNLPLGDSLFDFANCSEVLEHLEPDDFDIAVNELNRVTKGIIQVDTPNENLVTDVIRKFATHVLGFYKDHRPTTGEDVEAHPELFHHAHITASLLRSRGFKVYGCLGGVTRKYLRRYGVVGQSVATLYEFLSWRAPFLSGTVIGIKELQDTGPQ